MKKLIFLDIDGVLNSNRYYSTMDHQQLPVERDTYGDLFDPLSKLLLNKLIETTGADIVISSTWRGQGLKAMEQLWTDRKMSGKMVGTTPSFRWVVKSPNLLTDYDVSVPRGLEIQWYYQNKHEFHHWTYDAPFIADIKARCTLDTYVILDDDEDMLYEQRNNFVKCDSQFGFTQKEYDRAHLILMHGIV